MKIKIKAFSVSHFIYDQKNQRLIVYKNNGDLPRSIKCSKFKAFQIVNNYVCQTGSYVKLLTVPMIFNVKRGL